MVGFGEGIVGLSEFPYIRSLFFFSPSSGDHCLFGIWPKDEERAREESLGISGRQVVGGTVFFFPLFAFGVCFCFFIKRLFHGIPMDISFGYYP